MTGQAQLPQGEDWGLQWVPGEAAGPGGIIEAGSADYLGDVESSADDSMEDEDDDDDSDGDADGGKERGEEQRPGEASRPPR